MDEKYYFISVSMLPKNIREANEFESIMIAQKEKRFFSDFGHELVHC
jgi:hypothetical protein